MVSLKDEFLTVEGEYHYTVQAYAQGGAVAQAPGVMVVTPAEYDCTGATIGVPESEYRFDIPRENTEIPVVLFATSAVYVTPPSAGCFQTYELRMADGSSLPPRYEYDSDTGFVRFFNSGDQTFDDMLEIVISSSDISQYQDIYPHLQVTQPFRVMTECGPGSTDVSRPSLPEREQPANFAQNPLLASASFDSSNPRCPIETYALSAGDEQFNFDWNTVGFEVSLQNEFLSIPAIYYYTVQATALGDAFDTATGFMLIGPAEYDCTTAANFFG